MNKKTKVLIFTGILATLKATSSAAHLEPKQGDGTEKCYGIVKAHKNDCASKAGKHSCAGQAKTDNSLNDWIKLPQGICNRIVGGVVQATNKVENSENK